MGGLIVEIRINLLPQSNSHKEKRSVYLIPVLGIAAVVAALSFLTYSYFDTKDSIENIIREHCSTNN